MEVTLLSLKVIVSRLNSRTFQLPIRIAIVVVAILSCLFIMQAAARIGFSRLLARYAIVANSIQAADEAVRLTPSDPDVHRSRAAVLNRLRMPADARKALEVATSLRYRDDYLWLELGSTREELGDAEAALAAFDQAVRWAPYYAHTHWQRGNLRLRMGQYAEAFAELREAAASNRRFMPSLIDLAWGMSGGDAQAAEQLVQINNDQDRLAFARFLAGKGKGRETVEQLRLLGAPLSEENRRDLVHQLLRAKAYRQALELWRASESKATTIVNGGFEEPLILNNLGFGWVVSAEQSATSLTMDASERLMGTRSLRIGFDGNWNPGTPLLSQMIIVEGERRYRISFGIKTKDLVTGGAPFVTISDALSDHLLGKSEPFPSATSPWLTVSFDFLTMSTSEAVVLRLQRSSCASSPCPIFGAIWLDEFLIEELKPGIAKP